MSNAQPSGRNHLQQKQEDWLDHLWNSSRAIQTIDVYAQTLDSFVAHVGDISPAKVTTRQVEAWMQDQGEKVSSRTVVRKFSVVKNFFQWMLDRGDISFSPLRDLSPPSFDPNASPPLTNITPEQVRSVNGTSFEEIRARAFLEVLLVTCAPPKELVLMNRYQDLDSDGRVIYLPTSREPYRLSKAAWGRIEAYLLARKEKISGDRTASALWINPTTRRAMSWRTAYRAIEMAKGKLRKS